MSYIGPTIWNKTPDTLKLFLNKFSTIKNSHFHLQILTLKVLLLRVHNVNTSFYKHVLYYVFLPTAKVFFFFVNIQKATNTLNL